MNDELTPDERAAMRARIVGGARGIRPEGAHRNAWIAGSVAVALVVAIAGGVVATSTLSAPQIATTPTPSPTPTTIETAVPSPTPTGSTPSPTSTPDARVVAPPASRFSFGCDDVARTVRGFFGGVAPNVSNTLVSPRGYPWMDGPIEYALRQTGAVYCEFGDPERTWLAVAIMPDADAALAGPSTVSSGGCDAGYPRCEFVDGTLILVDGLDSSAPQRGITSAVDEVYSSLRDLVLSAPPGRAAFSSPPTGRTLGGDCATVLSSERLGQVLGLDGFTVQTASRGGWLLPSSLMSDYLNAPICEGRQVGGDDDDPFSTLIVGLPGGEWAYEDGASGEVLTVAGGDGTGAARLTCPPAQESPDCYVDILADGSWLRVWIPAAVDPAARPDVATQIAEIVLDNVRG